jgi:hypothetical protein
LIGVGFYPIVGDEAAKRNKTTTLFKELDDDEVVCGTTALASGGSSDSKFAVCSIISNVIRFAPRKHQNYIFNM